MSYSINPADFKRVVVERNALRAECEGLRSALEAQLAACRRVAELEKVLQAAQQLLAAGVPNDDSCAYCDSPDGHPEACLLVRLEAAVMAAELVSEKEQNVDTSAAHGDGVDMNGPQPVCSVCSAPIRLVSPPLCDECCKSIGPERLAIMMRMLDPNEDPEKLRAELRALSAKKSDEVG